MSDYDFKSHVASDVGIDQQFIQTQHLATQKNLHDIANWTKTNKMQLNENKTSYIIFNRTRNDFATRININGKLIERNRAIKLCGVWLQEDGGWGKNTDELCKNAYARIGLLTKLKYAGTGIEDLVKIYKTFIRSKLEFCSVAFHSGLSKQQSNTLDRCEATCLKIILQESYISYEAACEMLGLTKLSERRLARCYRFSQQCLKHPQNQRIFPRNENTNNLRSKEPFKVNFGYTEAYKRSAVPFCQRLLNSAAVHQEERGGGEEAEEEEQGRGEEGRREERTGEERRGEERRRQIGD